MKPRSNKKLKYFGKKTEDKYLIRHLIHGGKYFLDYYSSVAGYLKDSEHHHHNYVCRFTNFYRSRRDIDDFNAEEDLRTTLIRRKNRKSANKRCYSTKANNQERSWGREGLQMLRDDLESEKGYELTQKRYGSIAWDVY